MFLIIGFNSFFLPSSNSHGHVCVLPLRFFVWISRLIGDLVGDFWLKPKNTIRKGYNECLHCYLITPKGAEALLGFMWPIRHIARIEEYMKQNFDKFRVYFYAGDFVSKRQVLSDRRPPQKRHRLTGVFSHCFKEVRDFRPLQRCTHDEEQFHVVWINKRRFDRLGKTSCCAMLPL